MKGVGLALTALIGAAGLILIIKPDTLAPRDRLGLIGSRDLLQGYLNDLPFPASCPINVRSSLVRKQVQATLRHRHKEALLPGSLDVRVRMVNNHYQFDAHFRLRDGDRNVTVIMRQETQVTPILEISR